MPLNWSIKDIKKYKNNLDDAYVAIKEGNSEYFDVKPELKTLIFWGGAVGFTCISKANASEYYARSKVYEKYNKTSFMEKWSQGNGIEKVYLTMETVEDYIGLSTNHGTSSTTEWIKRFNKWLNKEEKVTVSLLKAELVVNKHEYEQWKAQKQKDLEGK